MDLSIAALAVAENLTLYTRNADDFTNLTSILTVIAI
jgi:predicted nucleic acid-binding protein